MCPLINDLKSSSFIVELCTYFSDHLNTYVESYIYIEGVKVRTILFQNSKPEIFSTSILHVYHLI